MASSESYCPKCGRPVVPQASYCACCGTRIFRDSKGAESVDPYLGETIDGIFEVESVLGTGSMGIVYKAHHRALNCHVALKILRHDYLSDCVVLTRFQREAQAASLLSHPNVIHILHYGKTALNAPYIAMECLEGDELAVVIPKEFPIDQRRVCSICLQTARALSAAHAASIIHRDLKPANIFIVNRNGTETVKVLDFGIAKICDVEGEGLTKEGAMCGTPAFMSPEQVLCKQVTPASDIFSFGSIMYYMLTCKLPFQGTCMVDMAQSILNSQPPLPSRARLDSYVAPQLEAICMKALEKDLDKRYHSANELVADLEKAYNEIENSVAEKPKIVVGDTTPSADMDGETRCSLPAMDEEEDAGGTVVEMQAMPDENDDGELEMLATTKGNTVSSAVGAFGHALSETFSMAKTERQLAPDECTVVHNSLAASIDVIEETKEETLARRKKLMLGFVCIIAVLCIVSLLVLMIFSWILKSDEPDSDNSNNSDVVGMADSNPGDKSSDLNGTDKKKDSDFDREELEYLAGVASDKTAKSGAIGTIIGIAGESLVPPAPKPETVDTDDNADGNNADIDDVKTDDLKKAEAKDADVAKMKDAEPEAPKPVRKPSSSKKASNKKASSSKTTTISKTPAKTSDKSSSGASAKLQQALSLEKTNKPKACEIYKSLLTNGTLSQTDKLKVQSKVRSCGRIEI